MSFGWLRPAMWMLFVSTHTEIIVLSYKNGLSEICKNGQSILLRMDSYFRASGYLQHVEVKYMMHGEEQ